MEMATINSKGQVTIPAAMRRRLHLAKGDRVRLFIEKDGSLAVLPATKPIRELYGVLKRPGQRPVAVEEMNRGAEEAATLPGFTLAK